MNFGNHRKVISLLVLALAMFLISVFYPELSARGFKYWTLYALSGLVLVFTVGTADSQRQAADYRLIAWVPLFLILELTLEFGHAVLLAESFNPATQINGMLLAALAPLIFLFQWRGENLKPGHYMVFYLLALMGLLFADSRTELLMLLLGVMLYWVFYTQRLRVLFVLVPLVLVAAVLAESYLFGAGELAINGDMYHWLDQLSSRRLAVWSEALSHPVENYLTGAGMHRSMEFLPQLDYVKHLHNLFIEIWYETGLLGLMAYLALVFALLSGFPAAYRRLSGLDRRVYAVFLGSGMAALIAGLLDKGYLHPLTRYYMLFCFTVLYLYHRRLAASRT
jgi:O-antigen ligase